MGSNRKLPFGYRMEQGRVIVDQEESRWVCHLFAQYSKGASYQELAEKMRQSGIPYDGDRPWNKNMIARILSNVRYCGCCGFPQIITLEAFAVASEKRDKKAAVLQKTEAQKILRRKCGCRITPHIEHEVLYLLNTLAGNPERIIAPELPDTRNPRLEALQSELDELLAQLPVDEARTREKVMEIGAAMYEAIDPREYETRRIQRLFEKEEQRAELDAGILDAVISSILVDSNGNLRLKLKNDQIIERGKVQ